jgi:hypothetical protein
MHLLDANFRLQVIELGGSQLAPGLAQTRGGLRGDAPSSFRTPGGDRLLLEGLANLVPVTRADPESERGNRPRGAARGPNGQVPAFAVLVDIDDEDAQDLAALRGHYEPAVAFVLDTVVHRAVDTLQDAGWHCIPVRRERDIPEAWSQVRREKGAAHDRV